MTLLCFCFQVLTDSVSMVVLGLGLLNSSMISIFCFLEFIWIFLFVSVLVIHLRDLDFYSSELFTIHFIFPFPRRLDLLHCSVVCCC